MESKKSFVLYLDSEVIFRNLPPEEGHMLNLAIYEYVRTNKIENFEALSERAKMGFYTMQVYLDRNNEKYARVCERNMENGKKGGAAIGNQNARKHINAIKPSEEYGLTASDIRYCDVIRDMFNNICGEVYTPIARLTDGRRINIIKMARNIEVQYPDKCRDDIISEVFSKMLQSDFLMGKTEKGFKADFNWVIKKNNWLKVYNGDYDWS